MSNSILAHFLDLYLEDQDAGIQSSLEDYQEKFPGYEELIEREYRALREPRVEETTASQLGDSPFARCLKLDLASGIQRSLDEYLKQYPTEADRVCTELGALDGQCSAALGAIVQPVDSMIGHVIGPYRIEGVLGRGGQAAVFLARDSRLGRLVALKVFSALSMLPGSSGYIRFEREANLIAKLEHPGIVRIHEIGEDGPIRYIAMQYVVGKTLAELVQKQRSEGMTGALALHASSTDEDEPTKEMQLVHFFERLARATHSAHEAGILHRDIKPANVMVTSEGRPVLLDFGLSREDDENLIGATQTGDQLGTPRYMSPEQIRAEDRSLDARTDIYSLGATLYECLTGQRVVEGESTESVYTNALSQDPRDVRSLNPEISLDLKYVLDTALEKERERRFANALDFAEDLRRVRSQEPVRARPASLVYRLQKTARRNKILVGGAISTAIALLIGGGFAVYFALGQIEQRAEARAALYRMGLHFASQQLDLNDPDKAASILAEAPTELRGWEWNYLSSLTDVAIARPATSAVGSNQRVVAWTASGEPRVAMGSSQSDRTLVLRDAATGRELQSFVGGRGLFATALSKCARYLAGVSASEATLYVWNVDSGALQFEYDLSPDLEYEDAWRWLSPTCFSDDETLITVPAELRTLVVLELETGAVRCSLDWPIRRTRAEDSFFFNALEISVALSPDSSRLFATNGAGESGRLVDLATGELLVEREPLTESISSNQFEPTLEAAWSPDGVTIAMRGARHEFYLLDADTLDVVATAPTGPEGTSVSFFPGGHRLLVGRGDSLQTWDLASDSSITWSDTSFKPARAAEVDDTSISQAYAEISRSTSISPDGERIVAASEAGLAVLGADGATKLQLEEGSYVYFCAWNPDASLLATGGWSRAVYLWEARTGELLARLPVDRQVIQALGFSEDGERVIALASKGEANLPRLYGWDAGTGEPLARIDQAPGVPRTTRVTEDALEAVNTSFWREVRGGSAMTSCSPGAVLRKSSSGRFVAGRACLNRKLRPGMVGVRDGDGGRLTFEFPAFPTQTKYALIPYDYSLPGMTAVAVSPGENEIVAYGARSNAEQARDWDRQGWLRCFDLSSGELRNEVVLPLTYSLDYHPDGNRIAAGLDTGTIAILNATTLELLHELKGHEWYVHCVSFSPDGTRLASSSGDGTTRIWDSVSESLRDQQKSAALAARHEIEPILRSLFELHRDSSQVAHELRTDESLSDLQRSEALIELLRRSAKR